MGLHIRNEEDVKWYDRYFSSLVGCTIEKAVLEQDAEGWGDEWWPTLTCRSPTGKVFMVSVSQDEEGNGPGWLFGLPTPEGEDDADS